VVKVCSANFKNEIGGPKKQNRKKFAHCFEGEKGLNRGMQRGTTKRVQKFLFKGYRGNWGEEEGNPGSFGGARRAREKFRGVDPEKVLAKGDLKKTLELKGRMN